MHLGSGFPSHAPGGSGGLSHGQAQLQAMDHKSPNCWILGVTHVSRTGSSEGGTGTGRSQSLLVGLWALCSSAGGPGTRGHGGAQLRNIHICPRPPPGAQASAQPFWNAGAVAVGGSLASCYKKLWCGLPVGRRRVVALRGQPPGASISHLQTPLPGPQPALPGHPATVP